MNTQKIILDCSLDIKTICSPLFAMLPIKYFAYTSIDHNNKLICFFSDGIWGENYFAKKYFLNDIHIPFCKDKNTTYSQYYIIDEITLDKENQIIAKDAYDFGLSHVFVISEKHESGYNFYHFAADPTAISVNNQYLNHLNFLKKFILFFKEKIIMSSKLNRILSMPYKLNINLGIENNCQTFACVQQQNQQPCLEIKRFYINKTQYITKKEQECLQLYAIGKSTHEISMLLNCSSHTVEKHFENIKRKFDSDKLATVIYWAIKLGVIN